MDRWVGRVALVTGASKGIGRAVASRLAHHGLVVVACARRLDQLMDLKAANADSKGRIIPIQCDLRKQEDIQAMFDLIRRETGGGGVDVCINNAGIGRFVSLLNGSTDLWREMLEINVLGPCICTREAIKSMRERGVDDGFIINVGSSAGRSMLWPTGLAFYGSTKYALSFLGKGLQSDLREDKSRIRIMELDPGVVHTTVLTTSAEKNILDRFYATAEALSVEDIADCVIFALSAPPRARVSDLLIEPIDSFDLTMIPADYTANDRS